MFTPSKTAWKMDSVGSAADTKPRKREEAQPVPSAFRLPTRFAAVLLASVSTAAWAADPVHVPAIEPTAAPTRVASTDPAPKRWPPPLPLLSPSVRLGPKERHAVRLVRRWDSRRIYPRPGPDGIVRWLYGATAPTVICAPLIACTILLQRGEVPTKIDLGDSTEWNPSLGASGAGASVRWEITVKPWDAGQRTNLNVLTNRRAYTIWLVSVRSPLQATRLTAFSYPADPNTELAGVQQAMGDAPPDSGPGGNIYLPYVIGGDDPSWRPLRVWSNGRKTFILFPPSMQYDQQGAPVLEGIEGGCGLCIFRGPATAVLNFRKWGQYYIYDGVIDRAMLVSGDTHVLLTRVGG